MSEQLQPPDGPSTMEYFETRFTILSDAMIQRDEAIVERISAAGDLREMRDDAVAARFVELGKELDRRFQDAEKVQTLIQQAAARAIDKSEQAQHNHNVASNEWRNTLNDFKNSAVSRVEFDRMEKDFSAYRLEASRLFSIEAGSRQGAREIKDDGKAFWALVVAVASALVTMAITFFRH